ncbi:MAG: hypothetical protein FJY29_05575 [Betaproteobacteria bacterium]|nr:hypothetical protein [Betaproteobacteria bacterium]
MKSNILSLPTRKTQRQRKLWMLWISQAVLLSLAACGTEASAQTNEEGSSIVINIKDWTAAGSGCRARMNKSGDVEFAELRSAPASASKLMVMKFKLPKYQLSSPPENPATSLTFARECALRVVAVPQVQYRIKSVAARTPVNFSKDEKTSLKMQYILKLDGHIVAHSLKEIDESGSIRNQDDKVVLAGQPSPEEAAVSRQDCGSPQMIGFDYTFIAGRTQPNDQAQIKLAEDKQLELAVELEACR